MRSTAGLFTYTFDAAGRSIGFRDPRTTWTYDAISQRPAQFNSNGTRVSYSYDAAGQVTRTTNVLSGGGVASDYATKYDKAGNRTQVTNTVSGLVTTYAYDKAYQLLVDRTTFDRNTYSYDPVGNRTVFRRADGTRATYTYDAANQMTRILDAGVPSTLTYDQAGNPLKQRNTGQPFNITMTWDAESRMTGYHQSGVSGGNSFNHQLGHVYNGDGLRVERTGGPGQAKYVWDDQNIHLKLSGANAILDSYRFEPATYGKLISTSSRWHLYDPLGSSTLLTSSVGGMQGTYRFGAWGEILEPFTNGTIVDPFLFVGREGYYSDDEGIGKNTTSPLLPYYVRARFYNALWGRWVNPDPIGFGSGDYNLFRYVANNPFNATDPSGRIGPFAFACLIGAAIGAGSAFAGLANSNNASACEIVVGGIIGALLGCVSGTLATLLGQLLPVIGTLGLPGPLVAGIIYGLTGGTIATGALGGPLANEIAKNICCALFPNSDACCPAQN